MPHVYGIDSAGEAFQKKAAELAAGVVGKTAGGVDESGKYPAESMKALADAGLMGLTMPADFGGKAQGPGVYCAVVEELATACPSTAMIYVMHVSASHAILGAPASPKRDAILKDICAGKHTTTLAWSEKGSRSQFWLPVSKLEAAGDGFKTNAQKSWVTSANHANSYVSSGQIPGAKSPAESAIYLVARTAPGVKVSGGYNGLGLRGNDSTPVTLEGVAVAKDDLLTTLGGGLGGMLQTVLPWFATGTAAMANGICRGSVSATGGHLSSAGFDVHGTKLRDLPNLRASIAQMSMKTESSRGLLGHTIAHMMAPSEITPLYVLQSRLAAIQAAVEVTDLAMKTCGGAAFSKHLPVERLFRDARAGWVMAPTADHLNDFVGKALTGLPLF
jgi:alkylation response protein AidB-like acyl-CoA dehydrogenase